MKSAIKGIAKRHAELLSNMATPITDMCLFLPDLSSVLYMCPNGQKAVVIIDEYDTPLVHILSEEGVDKQECSKVNTKHLKFGLVVGVFDVALLTMGSGLNNVALYQAHTGAWTLDIDENPFDTAFNLTAADVKGLVDQHVDLYAKDKAEDVRKSCKTDIMMYCFEHFDGYHYGSKGFIFNTYCVVKFLASIKRLTLLSQLPLKCMHYWASTGNMAMISFLHTDDAASFIEYAGSLVCDYAMRQSYRYGNQLVTGALLAKLRRIDMDTGISELGNLPSTDLPIELDANKLDDVASMCTKESLVDDVFAWLSDGHAVKSVLRLLYQAGYLTPLKSGRVGIPNCEAFEAFVQLSQKIYARSGLPVDFSDHTLRRLGLGHGDIFAFVRYMDEVYLQRSPVSSANLAESVYHLYMHALLAPLIGVGGFEIDHEGLSEGGRMDIRIGPVHDKQSTVRPYIVLELKQLSDDAKTKLGEAMSDRNLKSMSQKTSTKCQEAMTQIRQCYQGVGNHRAKGSAMILQIGITFWRYRFYLIAHRLSPTTNRAGEVLWVQKSFTDAEIAGHDTNNVKFTVDGGNPRASSIYKGEWVV
ncbi:hypothetical protein H4S03_002422 [Coemansia sp. S3946]|nr:hypothetical protein H4S03_002422 [Coemansia sp. S3946]